MQDYRAGYRNRNGGAASATDSEASETWGVTLAELDRNWREPVVPRTGDFG